ncbi:MAG: hypothetical protein QOC64_3436 [Solirubrobacteraceae bacterium]|nr:hypothetical protein [Solirubrobacteraceae bacterium]
MDPSARSSTVSVAFRTAVAPLRRSSTRRKVNGVPAFEPVPTATARGCAAVVVRVVSGSVCGSRPCVTVTVRVPPPPQPASTAAIASAGSALRAPSMERAYTRRSAT